MLLIALTYIPIDVMMLFLLLLLNTELMSEYFLWPKESARYVYDQCVWCVNTHRLLRLLMIIKVKRAFEIRLLQAAILLNVPLPNLWAQSLLFYEKWDDLFFFTFSYAPAKYSHFSCLRIKDRCLQSNVLSEHAAVFPITLLILVYRRQTETSLLYEC